MLSEQVLHQQHGVALVSRVFEDEGEAKRVEFATYRVNEEGERFFGHYFGSWSSAKDDYERRVEEAKADERKPLREGCDTACEDYEMCRKDEDYRDGCMVEFRGCHSD